MLLGAAGAAAQPFNQARLRYLEEQRECAGAYQRRLDQGCDASCRGAAESRRQRCLAASESRYRDVLRRALQARD